MKDILLKNLIKYGRSPLALTTPWYSGGFGNWKHLNDFGGQTVAVKISTLPTDCESVKLLRAAPRRLCSDIPFLFKDSQRLFRGFMKKILQQGSRFSNLLQTDVSAFVLIPTPKAPTS